ncbi:g_PROTEIN_RECEP_F3_4 domain-containing protein [Nephila pilipes]|uniref:G_PROTEIN_RECEP_F3_4 domain-containing protein n=1 Tax=Nephila pilipes TaxID=299642 RepID=A0A8X6Q4T6_NEPPI|nr:g_PROTEIN_RECEP_F3_4 domain-containing protein [Nephila pilipes]
MGKGSLRSRWVELISCSATFILYLCQSVVFIDCELRYKPFNMWIKVLSLILLVTPLTLTLEDNRGPLTSCSNDSMAPLPQPLAHRKRDSQNSVHIIGLFDVHEGESCQVLRPGGMEQVMMTIGVLENHLMTTDTNVTDIGFDVYDTCSNPSVALIHLVDALRKVDQHVTDCSARPFVGVIGPLNPQIQLDIGKFLLTPDVPYFPLQLTSLRDEIKAMSAVLLDLKWQSVAVFSATKSLEDEFRLEADKRNICIAFTFMLSLDTRIDTLLRLKFQEISSKGIQVAIVLGSSIDLRKLYEIAVESNTSIQYWLLAGLDTKDSLLSILFGPDHPVILFRKPVSQVPNIDQSTVEAYEFGLKINRLNLVQSYIEYINGCINNSSKSAVNEIRCQNHRFRTQNPQWSIIEETVTKLLGDVRKAGHLENVTDMNRTIEANNEQNQTSDEVEIWTFQHAIGKFSKHKEFQVGHYVDDHLIWDKKLLNVFRFTGSGWFKIPEFLCHRDCQEMCQNFANISLTTDFDSFLNSIYHWRYDSWVTILVTISGVGTVIALLIAAYLITKSCKDDFEEGNQVTNVIVLIAIVVSYCCSVLFMLRNDTSACSRRITVVGLAYVSMLAPVLARCFLIIAAEMDGIHSHVSGFLQSMLSAFIFAVQIAMAAYYWVLNTEIKRNRSKCVVHTKMTIAYLSYAMLLSLIWLIVSPFCIRSRRNNREGLLLHFGSIASCLIWLVWYLLFFLLHPRWNEFVICLGLVATASVILVVVFLPKVYRMIVSTAAREHGQVSMQPVIFASASSRSPNLSIYESINHGYNPDKDGYIVDVFRDEEESPRPRKMTHL